MLNIASGANVFVAKGKTDMRKSFCGLVGIVEKEFGKQVEDGDLFLFFNRKRDRLKLLLFTGDALVILYKKLERGSFETLRAEINSQPDLAYLTLSAEELHLLIEGIELSSIKRRNWWKKGS